MTESSEVMELPESTLKAFASMVTIVPDFEPGGGEKIIEQILAAKTIADIDAPWSGGRKMPTGRLLYITDIAKAPSDYPGGLPFYLVVSTVLPSTGQVTEYAAGSTMVVAQLVKAFSLKEFPIAGEVTETPIKTRPGQTAQHFTVDRAETDRVRAELTPTSTK